VAKVSGWRFERRNEEAFEVDGLPSEKSMGKIAPAELAFDIDGVIADTFRVFVETAKNQYGIQVEYEDISEYDFRKVVDIDDKTSFEIVRMILDNPVKMGIKPIEGAPGVLSRLSRFGPILLVTARPNREPILKWIQQEIMFEDAGLINLETTENYHEKLPILMKHGVRYFVEDRLETCYLLKETSITPIVFEQPWNRKPHPFAKVKGWDEISAMIEW
jgi:uncharacterized HAD superfamily protein